MTKERAIKVIDCVLNDMLCDGCIGEDTTSCAECRIEVADMAIEALQEKKTGKWIGYNAEDEKWLRDDGSPIFLSCSNCGNSVLNNGSPFWYYCPFCGAYMKGEKE